MRTMIDAGKLKIVGEEIKCAEVNLDGVEWSL